MFPKINRFSFKNRLPKNILNSQSFTVRYERNNEGLKTAVVVSKRVDKRATVRNNIKRKARSVLKENLSREQSLNLVLYIKKAITEETFEKELEEVLNKIKHV